MQKSRKAKINNAHIHAALRWRKSARSAARREKSVASNALRKSGDAIGPYDIHISYFILCFPIVKNYSR
jgi:hypothetical protein